jgi:hypothetical protein
MLPEVCQQRICCSVLPDNAHEQHTMLLTIMRLLRALLLLLLLVVVLVQEVMCSLRNVPANTSRHLRHLQVHAALIHMSNDINEQTASTC